MKTRILHVLEDLLWGALVAMASMFAAQHADAQTGLTPTGWTIGMHTLSWHSEPGYNNFNPGFYLRSPDGWQGGLYRNSIANPGANGSQARPISAYLARKFDVGSAPAFGTRVDFSLAPGLAVGYTKSVLPVLMFGAGVKTQDAGTWTLGVLPPAPRKHHVDPNGIQTRKKRGTWVFHLMLEETF